MYSEILYRSEISPTPRDLSTLSRALPRYQTRVILPKLMVSQRKFSTDIAFRQGTIGITLQTPGPLPF